MSNITFVSVAPLTGHAVITLGNEVYAFSPDEGLKKGAIHVGMWLQPAMQRQLGAPVREATFTDDAFPFEKAVAWAKHQKMGFEALDLFLNTIDPELTPEHRELSAKKIEVLLADEEIYKSLVATMTSDPQPKDSDGFDISLGPSSGKAGEILSMMRKKRAN